MAKIVCLGEMMMRLSTPSPIILSEANQLDVHYGGGEANVAMALAQWHHSVTYLSAFPKNSLGEAAHKHLMKMGIDTSFIQWNDQRMGLYFLETGSSVRPSKVTYDRKDSAIHAVNMSSIDWDKVFKDADWFHITGITPALGPIPRQWAFKALQEAKKRNLKTSLDLNYRQKLWTSVEAQNTLIPWLAYIDVVIGNEEDLQQCLGLHRHTINVSDGSLPFESFEELQKEVVTRWSVKIVATTLRTSISASHNRWQALLYDGKKHYRSRSYDLIPIIDRVGSGDAFAAGLIHGLLSHDIEKALSFAVAASALKHTQLGDTLISTHDDIEKLMLGDGSGRVQR